MRATKEHIKRLELIHQYLVEALEWIHSDDILICRETLPNGLSFKNKEGIAISPIEKRAGSKLQFIENAESRLRDTLKKLNN